MVMPVKYKGIYINKNIWLLHSLSGRWKPKLCLGNSSVVRYHATSIYSELLFKRSDMIVREHYNIYLYIHMFWELIYNLFSYLNDDCIICTYVIIYD